MPSDAASRSLGAPVQGAGGPVGISATNGVPSPTGSVDQRALERIGRALADQSRRRILVELLGGPAYPAELARRLGLGKANTSNHLACLRGCGLVVAEPEGRRVRYELADPRLADGIRSLATVVLAIDPDCGHGR